MAKTGAISINGKPYKKDEPKITMTINLFAEIYALLGVAKFGDEILSEKAIKARKDLMKLKESQIQ